MEPLAKGTLFAERYEIVRVLSVGGMGVVYEVKHLETQRRRALKVMLPSVLVDQDMRERFRREAIVTADIESEHIIEIFDAGVDTATKAPFLVMELLRGEDLGRRLESAGVLPLTEVLDLMTQLARALDKTHAANIVHRDLKPENLFLTKRDDGSTRLKVLDFGIAKLVSRARVEGMKTRAVGTPLFMAPEQITGDAIGPTADLYSMGHIVFNLLTGSSYWHEDSLQAAHVMALLLTVSMGANEPATARALRLGATLPAGFDPWFARATAVDPAKRFESAGEMVRALVEAMNGVEPVITSSTRRTIGAMATIPASTPVSEISQPHDTAAGAASAASARGETLHSPSSGALDRANHRSSPPPSSRTLAGDEVGSRRRGAWIVGALVAVGGIAAFAATRLLESDGTGAAATGASADTARETATATATATTPFIQAAPSPSVGAQPGASATPSASALASASAAPSMPPAPTWNGGVVPPRPSVPTVSTGPVVPIPSTYSGPRK